MTSLAPPKIRVYSVRDAARRVKRSRQTIQRWLGEGMPCTRPTPLVCQIREDDLLAWYRKRLLGAKVFRFGATRTDTTPGSLGGAL